MKSFDVVIVGGGPAGLTTAIAARRHGMSVLVTDSLRPPIEKPCGEGVMPDGVAAARSLGLDLAQLDAFPFRGVRFCHGPARVEASFPNSVGLGIRRHVLHRAMVERAEEAGVQFAWGSRIGGLSELNCGWVVGADGANSMVRRWAGLEAFEHDTRRYGFRLHYSIAPWSEYMELHWGDRCQFYVTPVSATEVCAVVISRNPSLRIDDALPKFPDLAARLRSVPTTDVERGSMTATRRLRSVWRGNVALVGCRFGFGGRDHGRRAVPVVSASVGASPRDGRGRSLAVRRAASQDRAAAGVHG